MIWSGIAVSGGRVALMVAFGMSGAVQPAASAHPPVSHGHVVGDAVSGNPDHDDALAARSRGEIKSLEEILQSLKPRPNDRMVDVVLDRRDGRWTYNVTWLTKEGRYRIFTVDAKDGIVLKDETK
jgi:hypothetical protein